MARRTPERELSRVMRAERRFLKKYMNKEPSKLDLFLEEKVPEKLESTLDAAFAKAFKLIFSKGSAIIEKSFSVTKLAMQFEDDSARMSERGKARDFRKFRRRAAVTGTTHTLVSGVTGIALGITGAWVPDIVVFLALLLRSMYKIAMRYGYEYTTEEEQKFMLRIIAAAVMDGDDMIKADREINRLLRRGIKADGSSVEDRINATAVALSHALLYMKFLQNIPVVGVIGGASDYIYMERINDYAVLKYQRRFLMDHLKAQESQPLPPDGAPL